MTKDYEQGAPAPYLTIAELQAHMKACGLPPSGEAPPSPTAHSKALPSESAMTPAPASTLFGHLEAISSAAQAISQQLGCSYNMKLTMDTAASNCFSLVITMPAPHGSRPCPKSPVPPPPPVGGSPSPTSTFNHCRKCARQTTCSVFGACWIAARKKVAGHGVP